jgi:hypothetical protein
MTTDPIDELRSINPVADDDLSSASLARIRARVSEDVMTNASAQGRRVPRFLPAGIGVAAVAAIALVLFVGGRNGAPSVVPGPSTGTGSAMCVEPYAGPASIVARTLAFDGTVTAIAGDRVTFTVNTAYRGAAEPSLTLDAAGMTGTAITSAGGPNLAVGERYLVAGDAHFAWACGYTQPYDAALAAQWATAAG